MNKFMDPKIEDSWKQVLLEEFNKDYFIALKEFLQKENSAGKQIFPSSNNIFKAFNSVKFNNIKVVIIGQDPYHGDGQAHGLSFSVPDGVKRPPSLVNIFKELNTDLNIPISNNGNLEKWANQGVLLLNATLTVMAHNAGSHQKKGWEEFTDAVIQNVNDKLSGVVFMLWGNYAKKKGSVIDSNKHYVLESAHPSPLSAYNGFYGCKHFSKCNKFLKKSNKSEIDWEIE